MSADFYIYEIECFPTELQTSSAVLYAIVNSIAWLQSNTSVPACKRCNADQRTVSEETRVKRFGISGEDDTLITPVAQPNESISTGRCSSILEHFDHVGRRSARSAIGLSKGISCWENL